MKKILSVLVFGAFSLSALAQEMSGADLIKRGEYHRRD